MVPDDKGWHPALEGAFTLIESSHTSVLFVETRRSNLMLHQDGDVAAYKRAVDRITKQSLQPDVSASFIADLRNRRRNAVTTEHTWWKPRRSANSHKCVELHNTLDQIRDSKNPAGPALRGDVPALVRAIQANQFDH